MTFIDFTSLVSKMPDGVILLEGRRSIPADSAEQAQAFARFLAARFPQLRFRSGNATGSDDAFSKGIASIDPSRLQIVAPYASHRKSARYADALYQSPDFLTPVAEEAIADKTNAASPKNKSLIAMRNKKGPLAAKAAYLIRDTMKVVGYSEDFPKVICGLFYVSMEDPLAGGTGHTIRVCMQEGVPYANQSSWASWPRE